MENWLFKEWVSMIKDHDKIALCDTQSEIKYVELIELCQIAARRYEENKIHLVGIHAANSVEWGLFFLKAFFSNVSIFVFPQNMSAEEVQIYCNNYEIQELYTDTRVIQYERIQDNPGRIYQKVVLFTSGSAGSPKGVVLDKKAIWGNALAVKNYMNMESDDRILIVKGLFHSSTISGELLLGIVAGVSVVFYLGTFFARKVMKVVQCEGITLIGGAPSMFCSLMKEKYNGSLRKIVVSGSHASPKVLTMMKKHFACDIFHVYGLTEAGPRVTYLPPEMLEVKPRSVGMEIKGTIVTIVDKTGICLPVGEIGEVVVESNYIMDGYLDFLMQSNEVSGAVKLKTGDIGYKDKDGYLFICGRKDNMICRSGENIWPNVIDESLLKVKGILESVTIGIEDDFLSQKIVSFIRVDKSYERKNVYVQCKYDGVLRPDEVYCMKEIPKLPNGKYDNILLKKMYTDRLKSITM